MAHINKVSKSLETADGTRCVDIFLKPDGTFGFEEYSRDYEDPRGWHAISTFSKMSFETEAAAVEKAIDLVTWLRADPPEGLIMSRSTQQ